MLAPLRSGHIYMKDTHSAEPNEKSIFRVIYNCIDNFQVCRLNFQVYRQPKKISSKVAKFTGKSGINLTMIFFFCETHSFRDIFNLINDFVQCSDRSFNTHAFFCEILSFWVTVDFVFNSVLVLQRKTWNLLQNMHLTLISEARVLSPKKDNMRTWFRR